MHVSNAPAIQEMHSSNARLLGRLRVHAQPPHARPREKDGLRRPSHVRVSAHWDTHTSNALGYAYVEGIGIRTRRMHWDTHTSNGAAAHTMEGMHGTETRQASGGTAIRHGQYNTYNNTKSTRGRRQPPQRRAGAAHDSMIHAQMRAAEAGDPAAACTRASSMSTGGAATFAKKATARRYASADAARSAGRQLLCAGQRDVMDHVCVCMGHCDVMDHVRVWGHRRSMRCT